MDPDSASRAALDLGRYETLFLEAWRRASGDPADAAAWGALAGAARELEADAILAGEYLLAYLASKIDGAARRALEGAALDPTRVQEVGEFLQLLRSAYDDRLSRYQPST